MQSFKSLLKQRSLRKIMSKKSVASMLVHMAGFVWWHAGHRYLLIWPLFLHGVSVVRKALYHLIFVIFLCLVMCSCSNCLPAKRLSTFGIYRVDFPSSLKSGRRIFAYIAVLFLVDPPSFCSLTRAHTFSTAQFCFFPIL